MGDTQLDNLTTLNFKLLYVLLTSSSCGVGEVENLKWSVFKL